MTAQRVFGFQQQRIIPGWAIIALNVATFGLYAFYWVYASWRVRRQELGGTLVHPLLHLLMLQVPILGAYRFYKHLSQLRRSADARRVDPKAEPLVGTVLWFVCPTPYDIFLSWDTLGQPDLYRWDLPAVVYMVSFAVIGGVMAWTQRDIDNGWLTNPIPPKRGLRAIELAVIVLGLSVWCWMFIDYRFLNTPSPVLPPGPPGGRPV